MNIVKRRTSKNPPQSGSVFTVLLAGIAIASALSYTLYQILSGPLSSMVRVTNKTSAQIGAQNAISTIVTDAISTFGDCDSDGSIEPRPWRVATGGAGSFPPNGGLLPNDIGAQLTDRWGTELGYCVWDVGTVIKNASCDGGGAGYNARRLSGTPTITTGIPGSLTVVAVISAGPNRTFDTSCRDYVDNATDVVYATSGGAAGAGVDDILERKTYAQLATQNADLWSLKVGTSTTAVIDKILEIGTLGSPQITMTPSTGLITTTGRIDATGGFKPASQASILDAACVAGTVGLMRYSTTISYPEACNGTSFLGPSIDSLTDGITNNTNNTFLGYESGKSISTGSGNTALGYKAMTAVTTTSSNTAVGAEAMGKSAGGSGNTAVGYQALWNVGSASANTAVGTQALQANTTGNYNTGIGEEALYANQGGHGNTALGYWALIANTSGGYNTAIGNSAMSVNKTGSFNTALGYSAGPNPNLTDMEGTVAIGNEAYAAANYTWVVGKQGIKQAIYEGPTDQGDVVTTAAAGIAILKNGYVNVHTPVITQYSRIFITANDPNGGTPGNIYISDRVPGDYFSIFSTSASDQSIVYWEIKEPNCINDLPAPDGTCN